MAEMAWIEKAFCRSAPWRAFTRKIVVPWALQGWKPGGRILEIGAGSGAMAAEILSVHSQVGMVVTDFDDAMLAGARETLMRFGDRAEIRTADATGLPFEDSSFDAVFSFIMLGLALDLQPHLQDVRPTTFSCQETRSWWDHRGSCCF